MALTTNEKTISRMLIQYNGGTAQEMERFAALTDEQALAEIAAYKENQLTALNGDLASLNAGVAAVNAKIAILTAQEIYDTTGSTTDYS